VLTDKTNNLKAMFHLARWIVAPFRRGDFDGIGTRHAAICRIASAGRRGYWERLRAGAGP